MVRRKHIRSLVEKLLQEHKIVSAPVLVKKIANALNAEVRLEAADDDLSGFLYRDRKKKQVIIGVNSEHSPNRRNFTTAHELGHYLLHDYDEVHVDRRFKVWLRNEKSSEGTDMEEREANLFAAELLMPLKFLEADIEEMESFDLLDDDKVIKKLAAKYGVSEQAMTFRLSYLGFLQQ